MSTNSRCSSGHLTHAPASARWSDAWRTGLRMLARAVNTMQAPAALALFGSGKWVLDGLVKRYNISS